MAFTGGKGFVTLMVKKKEKYFLEQGCASGGLQATTRPTKPFSVALINTLTFPHHA